MSFFVLHYGLASFILGTFLMVFFHLGPDHPLTRARGAFGVLPGAVSDIGTKVWIPGVLFFLSHGAAFVRDFLGRGEYRRPSSFLLMTWPYLRIGGVHTALLFMAIPFHFFPRVAAAAVPLAKMVLDRLMHRIELARLERADEDGAPTGKGWRHGEAVLNLAEAALALCVLAGILGAIAFAMF